MVHRPVSPAVPDYRDGARRLAAVAFTDIVGYSGVVHRDEVLGQKMVDRQNAIVRSVLQRFHGRVVKSTGDGFLLEFGSALSAVKAVAAIQTQLATDDQAAAVPVKLRASVHLGDVDPVRGDLYGDGVNIAARLMPLSPEGGVATSATVRMQVRQQLDLELRSIGTPPLKNIEAPLEIYVADPPALHALGAALLDEPWAPAVGESPAPAGPSRPWFKRAATLVGVAAVVAALLLAVRFAGRGDVHSDISEKSIAVLPFANLSSDKEQEYFSDGISEDLLNLLTKVPALQVVARTSSFSFKDKDVPISEIAKALHVAHLLQGSVRKAGNQVRITAQLVRAADGIQVWSSSWDRQLDDVFKIQDEIARAVADQLRVQLLGGAPTARPVDPKVYPLILQAEMLQRQFTQEGLAQSVSLYEQALAIAPNEARAWAGLARSLVNQMVLSELPPDEGARRIREAANKALELDPANVIALVSLGYVAGEIEHDLITAARDLERARDLEPGNTMVLNEVATLLLNLGRLDEALAICAYRVAHDPANPTAYGNLGAVRLAARQWEGSIDAFRTALRLVPDYWTARFNIGLALLLGKNDPAEALKEFEADTDELTRLQGMALALHASGRTKEADATVQSLIEKYGADQPMTVATVHAYRGDADAAFEWLQKAATRHDPYLTVVLTEALLDPLHGDPRWEPFLRTIRYAPEQLAKVEIKGTLPAPGD